MWALGVLLYEMATLYPKAKYDERKPQKQSPFTTRQIENGEHHKIPKRYSLHVHDILDALLQVKPEKRYSIKNALHLPGVIHELNSTQTSLKFLQLFKVAFRRRMTFGWASDKDVKTVQLLQQKFTSEDALVNEVIERYFRRIRYSGANFRIHQFKAAKKLLEQAKQEKMEMEKKVQELASQKMKSDSLLVQRRRPDRPSSET